MWLQKVLPLLMTHGKGENVHFCLSIHDFGSIWLPFPCHFACCVHLLYLKTWVLQSGKSNQTPYLLWKRSYERGRGCSDASFQGLPKRLQEVIRGKYVLSSSSSFRPPLDQPASVWENWFFSLPSSSPLFFLRLRFHLRLVHPLSRAVLRDRERKENS